MVSRYLGVGLLHHYAPANFRIVFTLVTMWGGVLIHLDHHLGIGFVYIILKFPEFGNQ